MPLDIDALILRSRELKKAGGTGLQVSEMLDREGVNADAKRFIFAQISKQELKERKEAISPATVFLKSFIGYCMIGGGLFMAYRLFMGFNGWSIISVVPFIICGIGLKIITSK